MRNGLFQFILLTVFSIRLHSASISPKNSTKKIYLRTVLPKNTRKDFVAAKLKHLRDKKGNHDIIGNARQQIAYNLDMINNNGSSSLLYSQDGDAVSGGFTEWTAWTTCSNDCKKTSLTSRERYCTDPSPSNGGADCVGERFQLKLCKRVPCSTTPSPVSENKQDGSYRSIDNSQSGNSFTDDVSWRLGEWSGWSKCNCKLREQKRYRQCYSHGGVGCPGDTVQTKSCQPVGCKGTGKSSLVDINPMDFCGFNPCDLSKCLVAPLGSCVADYKCRPVFFDEKSKRVEECVGKRIYIETEKVSQMCKVNPCDYTRCLLDFSEGRCVVGTKCQAVYYNPQGQPQTCTAILKVPPQQVCGYDPCSAESCGASPNARCLVTSKCRPIFVNAFNERIRKCEKAARNSNDVKSYKEDEFEAEPDEDDDEDDGDDDDEEEDNEDNNHDDENGFNKDKINENRNEVDSLTNNNEKFHHFNNESDDEDDDDSDDDDDDEDGDDDYYGSDNGNFRDNLAVHRGKGQSFSGQKGIQNNHGQNSSKPLLMKLLNTENGRRRTEKGRPKPPSNINAAALSLNDIIHGKLNSSRNVITGTMKKSMKILSSKKPTKFFYFEAKEGAGTKTRQFMVITAPKTKKSSVLVSKSRHKKVH